jgi:hypothetical protein
MKFISDANNYESSTTLTIVNSFPTPILFFLSACNVAMDSTDRRHNVVAENADIDGPRDVVPEIGGALVPD